MLDIRDHKMVEIIGKYFFFVMGKCNLLRLLMRLYCHVPLLLLWIILNLQLQREKAVLDEKLAEALATVAEEEEKNKGLSKLKSRHESSIGELEDKLHKEEKVRF